ncbi:MAG: hypothetical protein IPJ66_16410 [Bacteroidetes bacterium]|nr:hypothetical protein [Bacteroidota bacterium]MBL0066048.1 hypothetical protein [Bacteroidota bacterium]MBL0138116.1 hypothetical protein [Bacteroidota bacterium]
MKKIVQKTLLMTAIAGVFSVGQTKAQLSDQEYVAVTMDLQGILELTMTTEPQVDFVFNTIQKYQVGITKYNATRLEVEATVPWDLYAQPSTEFWTQQIAYGAGTNGTGTLPSEILEMQSIQANNVAAPLTFDNFIGLFSNLGGNTASLTPSLNTQFLAGEFGQGVASSYAPATSSASPLTNKFLVHYRIKPGVPANFPDLTTQYPTVATATFTATNPYAQPGFYDLEVVYTLTEDL